MDMQKVNRILEQHKVLRTLAEYVVLTAATMVLVVGVYVFKFPNNFSFGGVTGIAVILGKVGNLSPSTYNFIINMVLLVLGFIFLGRDFGIKTVYVSVLNSVLLSLADKFFPMSAPLTSQPMLELVFAIVLPSVAAAILFNFGASGGGTDIIAMIVKKHTSFNIGTALFIVDLIITLATCFVFDIQTGLFSFTGLMAKTLIIDSVIANLNLHKYFTIICDNPDPITDYIMNTLKRSATVYQAQGAYAHHQKTVILTVLDRHQAAQLRNFVHNVEPTSFITITNSSEIIGKGFHSFS